MTHKWFEFCIQTHAMHSSPRLIKNPNMFNIPQIQITMDPFFARPTQINPHPLSPRHSTARYPNNTLINTPASTDNDSSFP
jgi:hypothetical protein